jgi:hypothetical protein
VLFFRDIANVTMDLNDVETVHFNALGGADNINVGDLTGTDAKLVAIDLAGVIGGATGDSQPDAVTINGTNGDDVVSVSALGSKDVFDGLTRNRRPGTPMISWSSPPPATTSSMPARSRQGNRSPGGAGDDIISAAPATI